MLRITVIVAILLSFIAYLQSEKCKCLPAAPDQETSWGQENVIIKPDEVFKSLRGRVVIAANEQPLAGVLVEVYEKPEGLLLDWKDREAKKAQQRRIAACVTGPNGEFCFDKLPAGRYKLRCSKPIEWNSTSAYVIVAPKDPHSTTSKIRVPMQISQ